ncbi:hypothetical protein EZS27_016985 [termite gut metagenome]|uniref:DUF1905 domain-containing protein n=1 Tax=termite gut metagenome TaxID=433724 RepID=A0A5J4RKT0_9ZZZZ
MSAKFEFDAEIKKVLDNGWACVEFPLDVKEIFGKGRVRVNAMFDGVCYQKSLVKWELLAISSRYGKRYVGKSGSKQVIRDSCND